MRICYIIFISCSLIVALHANGQSTFIKHPFIFIKKIPKV
jgi:hypothetical protein